MSYEKRLLITSAGALGVAIANAFTAENAFVGAIATCLWFVASGLICTRLFKHNLPKATEVGLGVFIWVGVIASLTGVIYRLVNLRSVTVVTTLVLLELVLLVCGKLFMHTSIPLQTTESTARSGRLYDLSILTAFACCSAFAFFTLVSARTGDALRSPWHVVGSEFFTIYALAQLLLLSWLLWGRYNSTLAYIALAVATFLNVTVTVIIFRVGFGFDPFVHQATELAIAQSGAIEPKPWYYLGQYGFVVSLHWLTAWPIILIDSWLVPTLASFVLPLLLLETPPKRNLRTVSVAAAATLALPLAMFTYTTPQALGNLFFLAAICTAFFYTSVSLSSAWLFAITAFIIHPIAGIPALGFVFITWLLRRNIHIFFILLGSALGAAMLPISFYLQTAGIATTRIAAALPSIATESIWTNWLYATRQYLFLLDSTYLFVFNIPALLLLSTLGALYLFNKQGSLPKHLAPLLIAFVLIADAVIFATVVPQEFLIAYERGFFSTRLLQLAALALLPYLIVVLNGVASAIPIRVTSSAILILLFIVALRTAGVYASYPRFDGYQFDRGYTTSEADIEAVRAIDARATGQYIVLANQAVSAAALREFGFRDYFKATDGSGEQLFFYPIPTGGTLYRYYLSMVYEKPSRETVVDAMKLAGVTEAFFVLNDYWFDAETIGAQAQNEANDFWSVSDDTAKIFYFKLENTEQ